MKTNFKSNHKRTFIYSFVSFRYCYLYTQYWYCSRINKLYFFRSYFLFKRLYSSLSYIQFLYRKYFVAPSFFLNIFKICRRFLFYIEYFRFKLFYGSYHFKACFIKSIVNTISKDVFFLKKIKYLVSNLKKLIFLILLHKRIIVKFLNFYQLLYNLKNHRTLRLCIISTLKLCNFLISFKHFNTFKFFKYISIFFNYFYRSNFFINTIHFLFLRLLLLVPNF